MKLTIALAQLSVAFGQPATNFARVAAAVETAALQGASVVVLPEMWNTGYALNQLATLADPAGQQTKQLLTTLARQHQLGIVGGSVATARHGEFFNTSYVVDDTGRVIGTYDKVHLFGLMKEDQYLSAGKTTNRFELQQVPSAGFICYDLRFPEWMRTLGTTGVDVMYFVAQWPATRIQQWRRLLQARAIENQCFVVGVNRVGDDPDNHYNGHSLVIDPLGEVIADAGEAEQVQIVTLDLAQLQTVRGPIPVFADRRPELYR